MYAYHLFHEQGQTLIIPEVFSLLASASEYVCLPADTLIVTGAKFQPYYFLLNLREAAINWGSFSQ